jgi:hypothetical protein
MAAPIPVEPRDAAAPAAPAVAPAEGAEAPALPPEVVQIPAMQAILAGSPAAVSVPVEGFEGTAEGKAITAAKEPLMAAGIAFYRSLGGDLGAIFNRAYVDDQTIMEADKAGKLAELAPPLTSVNQSIATSGQNNPVLNAKAPEGMKTPAPKKISPVSMAQPKSVKSASPEAQSKAMTAKVRNLAIGSPTDGPKPGSGRILNSILKPIL